MRKSMPKWKRKRVISQAQAMTPFLEMAFLSAACLKPTLTNKRGTRILTRPHLPLLLILSLLPFPPAWCCWRHTEESVAESFVVVDWSYSFVIDYDPLLLILHFWSSVVLVLLFILKCIRLGWSTISNPWSRGKATTELDCCYLMILLRFKSSIQRLIRSWK